MNLFRSLFIDAKIMHLGILNVTKLVHNAHVVRGCRGLEGTLIFPLIANLRITRFKEKGFKSKFC